METPTLERIDERLSNLIADNSQEHEQILAQTTKTNGKVAEISKTQERLTGALIAINVIVLPVVIGVLINWLTAKL